MHVITRKRLSDFWRQHADAEAELRAWLRIIQAKRYAEHLEVREDFPKADFVGPRTVVFNIRRNDYRLVVDIRYDMGRVFIRHIVTHAKYDRLIKKGLL